MSNTEEFGDDDEIDLKEIFRTLSQYKYFIIFCMVLFGILAYIMAYFKPNIYQATMTIEVGISGAIKGGNDIVSRAISSSTEVNPDTEIEILKSRVLMVEALKSIDISHRYYTTYRMKKIEIPKEDCPFDINLTKGFGIIFNVLPYDKEHYRIKNKSLDINYIYRYGEEIQDDNFIFTLTLKKDRIIHNKEKYSFQVMNFDDCVSLGQKKLKVKVSGKYTTIIAISKTDKLAERVPKIVNALANAYITRNIEKRTREASKTLSFVERELDKITNELKTSSVKLEKFKKNLKTVDFDTKSNIVMKRLGDMEVELSKLNIELSMVESLYNRVKSGKKIESILINGLFNNNINPLSKIIDILQKYRIDLEKLKIDYTKDYPAVIRLEKEIKETKDILKSMVKNFRKNLLYRKKVLTKAIKKEQDLVEKLAEDEQIYHKLEQDFRLNEKIYSYLLEKKASSSIAKASTVSRSRILDKADYANKSGPNRHLIIAVGIFLGFIVGAMVAFIRGFIDDRIKNIEHIKRATDGIILGLVPLVKDMDKKNNKKDNHINSLRVFDYPRSSFTESFRNIRSNLKFMIDDNSPKVLTITSTISGEGKTSIGSNLAGIISLTKKRVILVNLDMRKPTLHEKFNLPNNKGISSVLSGYQILEDVIQKTSNSYLDIISSGAIPPNPSELIHSKEMEEVIEKLKKKYDIVMLDTPPSGLVTDAQLLMRMSDAVIYVVRANYAKKEFLKNIDMLSRDKSISGFSIILNAVDNSNTAYGYGYGGYYED